MSSMAIMLLYNEQWDVSNNFVNFVVDGIIISTKASHSELVFAIATQLRIDTRIKRLEIKFRVNDRCPPMEIRNDMGLRVYFETKKANKDLGSNPLCVSMIDFSLVGTDMDIDSMNDVSIPRDGLVPLGRINNS